MFFTLHLKTMPKDIFSISNKKQFVGFTLFTTVENPQELLYFILLLPNLHYFLASLQFKTIQHMQKLNLPSYQPRIVYENDKPRIFDVIRKKFVALTPEEWVRQHFIHLLLDLKYPAALMAVEKLVLVNNLRQRADLVVYNRKGEAALIVECKAPEIELCNKTIQQAARYNIQLDVPFIIVTNGMATYCVFTHPITKKQTVVSTIPTFENLNAPLDQFSEASTH